MTEQVREESFRRFLAARNAVGAYGLLENFEDQESFATVPSSSDFWVTKFALVDPNAYLQSFRILASQVSRLPSDAGDTSIVNYRLVGVNRLRVAATVITSGAVETLFTISQGGSMATQHQSIIDEPTVEEIIRHARITLPLRYRERLASRLNELESAVQEEDPDGHGITVKSLQHFVQFLKAYPALRCPAVSITPDRNIYASWKLRYDQVFSIHFLPDGDVRFVIFRPNEKHPAQAIRLSGTATADVIMDVATPHGVLDWASDERPSNPRL